MTPQPPSLGCLSLRNENGSFASLSAERQKADLLGKAPSDKHIEHVETVFLVLKKKTAAFDNIENAVCSDDIRKSLKAFLCLPNAVYIRMQMSMLACGGQRTFLTTTVFVCFV